MEKEQKIKFFNKCDLKELSYNFQINDTNRNLVLGLSRKISSLGGKISFTISAQTIIIVEEIHKRLIHKMLLKYKGFDKAVIFQNNAITFYKVHGKNEIISDGAKLKGAQTTIQEGALRIIKLSDLEIILQRLEKNSIEFHYKYGLPREVDLKSTISLLIGEGRKMSLHYHTFGIITDPKHINKKILDIPRYYKGTPEGFSNFMTFREKQQIQTIIQRANNNVSCNNSFISAKECIWDTPIPHKSNTYCTICHSNYDDYITHIRSESHIKFNHINNTIYDKIEQNFNKIRDYWGINKNELQTVSQMPNSFLSQKIETFNRLSHVNEVIDLTKDDTSVSKASFISNNQNLLKKKRKYTKKAKTDQTPVLPIKITRSSLKEQMRIDDSLRTFVEYYYKEDDFLRMNTKQKKNK